MVSSGLLRRVTLVRADVLEELSASIIRVTRFGELGKLAVTSNRHTLRRNAHFVFLRSVCRLLVTANAVPSLPILVTLITSQKAAFFIVPAVETSNLTR
jgi:hypothetical protein